MFIMRRCGEGEEGRIISLMHRFDKALLTESFVRRNVLFIRPCYVAENNLG